MQHPLRAAAQNEAGNGINRERAGAAGISFGDHAGTCLGEVRGHIDMGNTDMGNTGQEVDVQIVQAVRGGSSFCAWKYSNHFANMSSVSMQP